jgi:O-antigen/teichoic acid export membrane protein
MQQYKPLTLRLNFSWSFVGNAIYAACQWGMLVVLAKLGSPEIVGQFTLGLAVTAPVVMFTNLQLRDIQVTDAKYQYVFSDYLALRLLSTGLALLTIATITLAAGYSWENSLAILLIGLAKAFEAISDVFHGLLQQHERMDRIAMSLIIKGCLSLLLLGIGIHLSGSVVGGSIGLVVAWALILVAYDIRSGASMLGYSLPTSQNEESSKQELAVALQPRWHLGTLGKLAWFSLPLGFVTMLGSLNVNIPRYIIEWYLGDRELGIFAAIAYVMVAGNMVVSALGQSATPRLAKYYAAGDSLAFRTLLLKLLGVGSLLGGAAIAIAFFAGEEILTVLYRPEYAQYADLLVWLMVAAAIKYTFYFLGDGMIAVRYFRIQIPLFILVTGTSAAGCFWLLPTLGLQGIAIALIVSAIVQASLSSGVIIYALYRLHRHRERKRDDSPS